MPGIAVGVGKNGVLKITGFLHTESVFPWCCLFCGHRKSGICGSPKAGNAAYAGKAFFVVICDDEWRARL